MIAMYENPESRRAHGKEGVFAFKVLGHCVLQAFPNDTACIVGGYPRDMLLQDAWARNFYGAMQSREYENWVDQWYFSGREHHPDSYTGRTMCAKDIDVLTFSDFSPQELKTRISHAFKQVIPQYVSVGAPQELNNEYMFIPDYVNGIFSFKCEYHYGGITTHKKIAFKIDVIQVKDQSSISLFQANAPFSSDSFIAHSKCANKTINEIARLSIRELFIFTDEKGRLVSDCPDDVFHFKATLKPSTIQNASHSLNVVRRVVQKTRLGWRIDGLCFKIFLSNGEIYMNTSRGKMKATDVVLRFHNQPHVEYHGGYLESPTACLRLFWTRSCHTKDRLVIETSDCDDFHLVEEEGTRA